MSDPTMPQPEPIPEGITQAKIGQWKYCLLGLMDCFENNVNAAPDWLVDALYDVALDPANQASLQEAAKP